MRAGNSLFPLLPGNPARVAEWVSRRGLRFPSDGRQVAGALRKRGLSSAACEAKAGFRVPDGPKQSLFEMRGRPHFTVLLGLRGLHS